MVPLLARLIPLAIAEVQCPNENDTRVAIFKRPFLRHCLPWVIKSKKLSKIFCDFPSLPTMPSKCPPRTPIILYDNCMSANEAEYYDSLSTCEAPPLDPSLALSRIVEIPADMYQHFVADERFQAMLSRMFDEISIPQFRALYILQIGTLALGRSDGGFKTFQQSIASIRRSGLLRELIKPADLFTCKQTFCARMMLTGSLRKDLPVDLFAHIHNWGQDYHIRYPVLPIGDWPIPKREPKFTKTSRPGWIMPGDSDDEELGHDGNLKECE